MHTAILLMALFPTDLHGDMHICDHLVIDQYGIDVVIPWDESNRAALASEWQEPHLHRALVMHLIRTSYQDIDWALSESAKFFRGMPFLTDGYSDTKYQNLLRGIIEL